MTDLVTLARIRSQIIGYLELASSFDEQAAYQAAAPHIHVPNEIINQWEDLIQPDWRGYMISPVFSQDEIEAIGRFYGVWDTVASTTPDPLPDLEVLFAALEWQQLAAASAAALKVFQVRGRCPDSPDGA